MQVRRHRDDRGATDAGWLQSKHTFSFGHYHDPAQMGFGHLRVINEDRVIAGAGFGTHAHNNMEIISYVIKGALAHKDNMGNGSTIRHGDVQIMSAGTGVTHSEYNESDSDPVHFLQMWVLPNVRDEAPNYQEKSFGDDAFRNTFAVVASPDGAGGSLRIKQDARLLIGRFDKDFERSIALQDGRKTWLQIASGCAILGDHEALAGDGFAISGEKTLQLKALSDCEMLMFDLA